MLALSPHGWEGGGCPHSDQATAFPHLLPLAPRASPMALVAVPCHHPRVEGTMTQLGPSPAAAAPPAPAPIVLALALVPLPAPAPAALGAFCRGAGGCRGQSVSPPRLPRGWSGAGSCHRSRGGRCARGSAPGPALGSGPAGNGAGEALGSLLMSLWVLCQCHLGGALGTPWDCLCTSEACNRSSLWRLSIKSHENPILLLSWPSG